MKSAVLLPSTSDSRYQEKKKISNYNIITFLIITVVFFHYCGSRAVLFEIFYRPPWRPRYQLSCIHHASALTMSYSEYLFSLNPYSRTSNISIIKGDSIDRHQRPRPLFAPPRRPWRRKRLASIPGGSMIFLSRRSRATKSSSLLLFLGCQEETSFLPTVLIPRLQARIHEVRLCLNDSRSHEIEREISTPSQPLSSPAPRVRISELLMMAVLNAQVNDSGPEAFARSVPFFVDEPIPQSCYLCLGNRRLCHLWRVRFALW